VFCFCLLVWSGHAQKVVPFFGKIQWINGYAKEIGGENIGYFSAFPDYATVALLTRATDGHKAIEWETAPVPALTRGPYIYFSWVAAHSSGTSSGIRHFDLYINDQKRLTFSTLPAHQAPDWHFATSDSLAVVFQQTKRDAPNDAHGLMFLRVPVSMVAPGKPLKIKVIGQAQNSNDWYMTFKFGFEEKVELVPMPFLLQNGQQPIALSVLHFGPPRKIKVRVQHHGTHSFWTGEGISRFEIPVTPVTRKDSLRVEVTAGKKTLTAQYVPLAPVTPRTLHLIHHSHTDIGYSHLQPEVVRIHNKNIDDALTMIKATAGLPVEARFKWNIESLWAVENYLQQATDDQREAFLAAVKSGSVCLSAFYANLLTGMSLPEEVFHYLDYAHRLKSQYGVTIRSAMMSDVPGCAWTTVTALAQGGVRYFSSGPNFISVTHPYHGDRVGHFNKNWGDRPVWWASPSGQEKVLLWTGGKGYSAWHGTAPGGVFEKGPKKIAAYLQELDASGYPYDMVQWRYNIVADNGPIDTSISRFVAFWNARYSTPKLVLNTTDRLFEAFEQKYGSVLPVVQGDITPYWEDGAVSTAAEEGNNRLLSLQLQQLTILYALLQPQGYDADAFYEAWKNVLLFHEHTWGAHNSISAPDLPFVTEQWRIKKEFLTTAAAHTKALEEKLWQPFQQPASKKIMVCNTASWKRTGLVTFSSTAVGKSVRDTADRLLPLQHLSTGQYAFVATNIPALGCAVFELSEESPAESVSPFMWTDSSLSNSRLTAVWDTEGSITTLRGGDAFNFAGQFKGQGLNSYWYVPGLDPGTAQTHPPVSLKVVEKGPVLTTVLLSTETPPGARRLEKRISSIAGSDLLYIENTLDKTAVRTKEAVHFGFPFHPSLHTTTVDAGYGTFQHLRGQLPGSNLDFLCARRWLDVSDVGKGIQWLLLETPMVEPDAMIDERLTIQQAHKAWRSEGRPTAQWFSYAMNNYWHTNYKADQEGMVRFRYVLRPHGADAPETAEKTAADVTRPLVAMPVHETISAKPSLFELTTPQVVVTNIEAVPGSGYRVRLFNTHKEQVSVGFKWQGLQPVVLRAVTTGQEFDPGASVEMPGMGVTEWLVAITR
jgi:hypothetical protein